MIVALSTCVMAMAGWMIKSIGVDVRVMKYCSSNNDK